MAGFPCPGCGLTSHKVIETRLQPKESAKRRRLACKSCGLRFTTQEKIWNGKELPVKTVLPREPSVKTKLKRIEAKLDALAIALLRAAEWPEAD